MGGKLDPAMGGRPVNIESEPYSPRRSIYGFIDRTQMAEFMRHFDVANPGLPTGKRHGTIVPQQALIECGDAATGKGPLAVVPLLDGERIAGFEIRCGCGASAIVECVYPTEA